IQPLITLVLAFSPIMSWGDTIYAIHRKKSSAGLSLDLCGIMLFSSVLRIFFWFGNPFNDALLIQAVTTALTHTAFLYLALKYRPIEEPMIQNKIELGNIEPKVVFGDPNLVSDRIDLFNDKPGRARSPLDILASLKRPYSIWLWNEPVIYWKFLTGFIATLLMLQLIFGWSSTYIEIVGFLSTLIEAFLPVPQMIKIHTSQNSDGIRFSLIGSWLLGDLMKIIFYFNGSNISLQFKLCALLQAFFDICITYQTLRYRKSSR
ncbi:hypothetical protein CANCADRAFT_16922, partial [Tortispora caseinolytica NRRL Y-17796]